MAGFFSRLKQTFMNDDSDELSRRALVTGSVAAGALITGAVLRTMRKQGMQATQLSPALDASIHDMEIMEGRYRFYAREGTGVPIVLLHSINAAASSFEMKPLFEHFAQSTARPVFAVDWIGFGLSDRPPVDYRPPIFQRQLRRFLSEKIHQPADVIAYSLGCEFAAITARSHPFLFRRMVLVCPTSLGAQDESQVRRSLLHVAEQTGVFEIAYRKLVKTETLRKFYQRQVFANPAAVPAELVEYARLSSHVRGAHHAPANFIAGDLFSPSAAVDAYASTIIPTLIIAPRRFRSGIQSFENLDDVLNRNPEHLSVFRTEGGLMPQFENPRPTLDAIGAFLS